MNIFDKLGFTNLEYGSIQNVDEMTILPILGENRIKNIAKPNDINFRRTRGYGNMEFENSNSSGFGIIPSNTMVLSKQAAQDHAMSDVGLVPANTSITFENACCIQQSQGGYLDGSKDDNEYNILPLGLRKKLLSSTFRNKIGFDKLWPAITEWISNVPGIINGCGHLEYFFTPFKKELEDFVAEFEPVEGQLGAAIFFNDIPVGLEIMPTVDHWSNYWKWLIRGCYGAQLLNLKKSGNISTSKISLPKLEGNIVDQLEKFFQEIKVDFLNKLNFSKSIIDSKAIRYISGIEKKLIKIGNGGGDLITEHDQPIYLSAIL